MKFGGSPFKVVTSVFTSHPWEDHMFHRLPKNSSKLKSEAVSILKRAETQLKINEPADWYRISKLQLRETIGETLCKKIIELPDDLLLHLRSCYPRHAWERDCFVYFGTRRSAQRLLKTIVTEILRAEGNESEVYEDYVHPQLRLASEQSVTYDVFVPTLNMAFEYGGEQHYDHRVFGAQNKYSNDVDKRTLSLAHGIKFIDIPYWWDKKKDSVAQEMKKYRSDATE